MKAKQIIDELIGWYGTIAIIGAFTFVSFEILAPTSLLFQCLNITGALGLAYISFRRNAYQPCIINLFVAVIAGIAIIRLFV